MLSQRTAISVVFATLMLSVAGQAQVQTNRTRLAAEARLDLYATTNVGSLAQAEVLSWAGSVGRLSWMKPADQPRALTASFPVTHFNTNELVLRFTPQESGRVTLSLLGPYERIPGDKEAIYQADLLWDLIDVAGAQIVPESAALLHPPVRSSFRQRYDLGILVQAHTPVTLRCLARSALPPEFDDPPPNPAHESKTTQLLQRFRRGVSLHLGAELLKGGSQAAGTSDEDFSAMRREGFDHVRLAVTWHLGMGAGPEYLIAPELLTQVDLLLARATKQDLGVVVSCQEFDALGQNPQGELPRFVALWKQVASHWADLPSTVAFELLAPSSNRASTPALGAVYGEVLRVVRVTNPHRLVMVSPGRQGSPVELARLSLPSTDVELAVSVHSREPEPFTQQWAGRTGTPVGIRFPGPPDGPVAVDAATVADLGTREWMTRYQTAPAERNPSGPMMLRGLTRLAKEWSRHTGRPVYFAEWGCSHRIDAASRARYYAAWREALDQEGIPWGISDWRQANRYWDEKAGQPMVGLHEALFPGRVAAPRAVESPEPFRNAMRELRELRQQIAAEGRQSAEELTSLRARALEMQEEARLSQQGSRWLSAGAIVVALVVLALGLVAIFYRRSQSPGLDLVLSGRAGVAAAAAPAVREGTMAHLARLMMDRFVMRLLSDRRESHLVQHQAAQDLAEMEQRLEQLRAPLQDRMRAYERRIADLEQDLARKGQENRELIRAKIALTHERLMSARSTQASDDWKPSPMENFGVQE